MKIYALNGMQSHCNNVKKNVELHGSIVLRGFYTDGTIQLLEGSHRMAYALELGVPITIVLFGENEIIPHDCDGIISYVTGLSDRCTVRELADNLVKERGLFNQAVYESDEHQNICIIDASDSTGKLVHFALTHTTGIVSEAIESQGLGDAINNPSSAFPEKVWQILFGEKNAYGSKILVIGNGDNRPAIAFCRLGAEVTYIDLSEEKKQHTIDFAIENHLDIDIKDFTGFRLESFDENTYDILYTAPDVCSFTDDLYMMYENYKRVLKQNGLLVMLDTHPFMNLFEKKIPEIYIYRTYDDLRPQTASNRRYWRVGDITRWLLASKLRLYALIELQSGYDLFDSLWYSSVKERFDDKDRLSDLTHNPLSAIPQWLVTFAYKQ
ncbi:MAG: class I SAM-dependent methyltransferase [Bacillota bacterium]